jgi:hypothetical protein
MRAVSRAQANGLFEWNSSLSRIVDVFIGVPSALALAILSGEGFFLSVRLSVWIMVVASALGFAGCLVLLYVTVARARTQNRRWISAILALGVLLAIPVSLLLLSIPVYARFVLATMGASFVAIKHIVTLSKAAVEVHP